MFDALRAAGFKGSIYPVNPNGTEIDGIACYASARDVPAGVDLAVPAIPHDAVFGVVENHDILRWRKPT